MAVLDLSCVKVILCSLMSSVVLADLIGSWNLLLFNLNRLQTHELVRLYLLAFFPHNYSAISDGKLASSL